MVEGGRGEGSLFRRVGVGIWSIGDSPGRVESGGEDVNTSRLFSSTTPSSTIIELESPDLDDPTLPLRCPSPEDFVHLDPLPPSPFLRLPRRVILDDYPSYARVFFVLFLVLLSFSIFTLIPLILFFYLLHPLSPVRPFCVEVYRHVSRGTGQAVWWVGERRSFRPSLFVIFPNETNCDIS